MVLKATGRSEWEVEFTDDKSHHILTSSMLLSIDTARFVNRFTGGHNEHVVDIISEPSSMNNEGAQNQNETNNPNNYIPPDSSEVIIDVIENEIADSTEPYNLSNIVEENFPSQTVFNSIPVEIEDLSGDSLNFLQEKEDLSLEGLNNQQLMEELPELDVYKANQKLYETEKQLLIESGLTFTKVRKGTPYVWKIIKSNDSRNNDAPYLNDFKNIGLCGFSFSKFDSMLFPYAELFLRLYPSIDWMSNLKQMNEQIKWNNSKEKKKIRLISPKE